MLDAVVIFRYAVRYAVRLIMCESSWPTIDGFAH